MVEKHVAILIVAAGKSERMNACKIALQIDGQSLLEKTLIAASAVVKDVYVVSGAYEEEVDRCAMLFPFCRVHNADYDHGLSSTIKCGIDAIHASHPRQAVIISVADQPYISAHVFRLLIDAHHQYSDTVIVSDYGDTFGVPCLFPSSKIDLLYQLEGDQGAKKVLSLAADQLIKIPFPEGSVDLDTPEDLEKYLLKNKSL